MLMDHPRVRVKVGCAHLSTRDIVAMVHPVSMSISVLFVVNMDMEPLIAGKEREAEAARPDTNQITIMTSIVITQEKNTNSNITVGSVMVNIDRFCGDC